MKFIVYIFTFFTLFFQTDTFNLNVEITNIRNSKGVLLISVFNNQKQFDDEVPDKNFIVEKNNIKNGNKTVKIKLPSGTYGITVLDDEDKSGDVTYKFKIYPIEGVGFSNYVLSGLSKPDFEDFDFSISNSDKVVLVKMKYF